MADKQSSGPKAEGFVINVRIDSIDVGCKVHEVLSHKDGFPMGLDNAKDLEEFRMTSSIE